MAWQNPKTDWTAADGVRDTDFNRIEGNILELYNKAGLAADLNIYVSPSGSDVTGEGNYGRPFQTIAKAISALPKHLDGFTANIHLADGTYDENVSFSGILGDVAFLILGNVTIASLTIDAGHVHLDGDLTVTNGIELKNAALLRTSFDLIANRGVEVTSGSVLVVTGKLTSNNASNALRVSEGSRAYVSTLSGTGNTSGLVAITGGIAAYNSMDITATTQRHTATGGRIYSGAQTSVPNY